VRTKLDPSTERCRVNGESFSGWYRLPGPHGTTLFAVVANGEDFEEAGLPGEPWEHVSVSTSRRCPTWSEMEWVRSLFFEDDETVLQFSVPRAKHINLHPFVLHMWRPTVTTIPLPPKECV